MLGFLMRTEDDERDAGAEDEKGDQISLVRFHKLFHRLPRQTGDFEREEVDLCCPID